MKKAIGGLVVLVLAATTASACGGGSGDCTPTCGPAFECYYGVCVPREPDFGHDGTSDGDADGDAPPRDDGTSDDAADVHSEGGGCTVPEDCADGNPCTQDVCDSTTGSCRNPDAADGTPCSDGICCGAECRVGGDCCTDAECTGGCRGTAQRCAEIPGDSCSGQAGCSGTGEAYCEDTHPRCGLLTYGDDPCEECGCSLMLVGVSWACTGLSGVNCASLGVDYCADCGCTWHAGCDGVHDACETYPDQATCDGQFDCYWSTCLDHRCT